MEYVFTFIFVALVVAILVALHYRSEHQWSESKFEDWRSHAIKMERERDALQTNVQACDDLIAVQREALLTAQEKAANLEALRLKVMDLCHRRGKEHEPVDPFLPDILPMNPNFDESTPA